MAHLYRSDDERAIPIVDKRRVQMVIESVKHQAFVRVPHSNLRRQTAINL